MNIDFKDIVNLVEKNGITGIFSIFLVFIIYNIIKSDWMSDKLGKLSDFFIDKFIKNKVSETDVKKVSSSDIENHDIFNFVDFWMYSKIPTIIFSTDYRTAVFRKYLIIFIKCYKDNIDVFIKSKQFETMDEPQILKAFLNLINQTVYDYEKEIREVGVPAIIVEKMKIKNNDNILLTIDLIEGICSSSFYDSEKNYLKVYSILNIFLSVLDSTINSLNSSEFICNSINGQLKGLEFNGFIEP